MYEGKTVITRPEAKILRSLPKLIKYLEKSYTIFVLFLRFALL